MEIQERIKVVSEIQKVCVDVFKAVAILLKVGMSEADIAELIRLEFQKRGVVDFWYDVPIIVLVGVERFLNAANSDYATKSPSSDVLLNEGDTIYVDLHPRDGTTELWGDWDTMAVFHPRKGVDDEQVAFLREMQQIHRECIAKLTPTMTGADVVSYFLGAYRERGITPIIGKKPDMGHTIHEGLKINSKRSLLDLENTTPIGGNIYAVEPAGYRHKKSGDGMVVGRFEESVYVPLNGSPVILGNQELLPVVV